MTELPRAYLLTDMQRQVIHTIFTELFENGLIGPLSQLEMGLIEKVIPIMAEPIIDELQEDLPLWQTNLFTDEERERLYQLKSEEVSDSIKSITHDYLDNDPLIELLGYLDEDTEVTVELLQCIVSTHACMEDYMWGEHPSHKQSAEFMTRFKLVDSGGKVTELGHEFIERYS